MTRVQHELQIYKKSTDLRNRLSMYVLFHIAFSQGHLEARNWRKLQWATVALTKLRVSSLTYVATLRPEASRIIMSNNNMGAFICLPFLWFPVVWTFHIAHINGEQRCSECCWVCSFSYKQRNLHPTVHEWSTCLLNQAGNCVRIKNSFWLQDWVCRFIRNVGDHLQYHSIIPGANLGLGRLGSCLGRQIWRGGF